MLRALYPSKLEGEVQAVASKSFVHRILIAAALSNKPTKIIGRITGEDIAATSNCLNALDANVTATQYGLEVSPIVNSRREIFLDCGESGSTLRFILPLVCALEINCKISGKGRLAERPLSELIKVLTDKGGIIEGDKLPLKVGGRLRSGDYVVPAYISSQYITGLLLALPILDGDSRIILEGETVSAPYIDITLGVLKDFGIDIKREKSGFNIKGNQIYHSKGEIIAEGDWSNAAFFIAGGVLSGDVTVSGVSAESLQGDRAVIDILKEMDGNINIKDGRVRAKQSNLHGISVDVRDIPDLVPVLAITAMHAEGKTVFTGVERLKDKESDRLSAVIESVTRLGGNAEYKDGRLTVYGKVISGGRADLLSYNDHRMAMSAAIAALKFNGKIILEGSGSVSKSYPEFFQDYKKLGGLTDVIQS